MRINLVKAVLGLGVPGALPTTGSSEANSPLDLLLAVGYLHHPQHRTVLETSRIHSRRGAYRGRETPSSARRATSTTSAALKLRGHLLPWNPFLTVGTEFASRPGAKETEKCRSSRRRVGRDQVITKTLHGFVKASSSGVVAY